MMRVIVMTEWKPTACILCACNCGVEVQAQRMQAVGFHSVMTMTSIIVRLDRSERIDSWTSG